MPLLKAKLIKFVKPGKSILLRLGIGLATLYLAFYCPLTKITPERLVDLLSNRRPPAWMMPKGGTIDVHQTQLYKYQKLIQLRIEANSVGQDVLAFIGIRNSVGKTKAKDWSDLHTDLAAASNTLAQFWGVSIVTYQDQTYVIGEDSKPINLNDRVLHWQKEIESAAAKYNLEPALIAAVIEQESGGDPVAVSPQGAIGLMQLMPATAQSLGVNPYDPAQNIAGGAHYLQIQLQTFGSVQAALAAYNAGPGRVNNRTWVTLPETMNYVQRVPILEAKYVKMWQENRQETSTKSSLQ